MALIVYVEQQHIHDVHLHDPDRLAENPLDKRRKSVTRYLSQKMDVGRRRVRGLWRSLLLPKPALENV